MVPEQSRSFFVGVSYALEGTALGSRPRLASIILDDRRPFLPNVTKVVGKSGEYGAPIRRNWIFLFGCNRPDKHEQASASEERCVPIMFSFSCQALKRAAFEILPPNGRMLDIELRSALSLLGEANTSGAGA